MMRPFKALLTTTLLLEILILVSLYHTARLNSKDLWKELTSFYSICAANFRLSGTHERQFKPFVQGKMDLLYLWYWLKISLVTEPSVPTYSRSNSLTGATRGPLQCPRWIVRGGQI
ncbi:hypothetical protein F444_00272 [Phytophthora nicotianae P1976]|uniref:Uncharacterized protein n=1 Tax=Phytophthora nicotianae P1976 TaxID=1317066 RepID=A0A081B4T7_PHYNI|nr:hypothetical protein F444_00272 [Phytophthora nicotianae P1976]